MHWNSHWLKMLIKTVTVVLKLFCFHLFIKFVLCAYVWVYTLKDLQNQKRLNKLWSWDVEVKFIEIKNMFGFYISHCHWYISLSSVRKEQVALRLRQYTIVGRRLFFPEPVILPVSLFFDARGIWLYVRKTNYWKVFFSLFNLPLYWGYSVQLIHMDIKLILSGITERHCGYYMLCCVLYLFKLFTFQIT